MTLNFPQLKEFQEFALNILLSPNPSHLLCIAATGSGKSLIFQKYLKDHPQKKAILISPLNALSLQHHRDFQNLGVSSQFLSPSFTENTLPPNESQVWILSPEKIFSHQDFSFLKKLKNFKPEFLIVDECHCVFEWGAHFRPSFQKVLNLVQQLELKKSLWLTATLEKKHKLTLKKHISEHFYECGQFSLAQNLNLRQLNISYPQRIEFLTEFLEKNGGVSPGVIFTSSRKSAEKLSSFIHHLNLKCTYFHAGLSLEEKKIIYSQLESKKIHALVATTAFGMGMNYDYFEWGIAYQPLYSISQLAQALGRVGRNKKIKNALGLILWDENDFYELHSSETHEVEKNIFFQNQILELYHFLKSQAPLTTKFNQYFNDKNE